MLDIVINPFITILLFLYQILGGNVVLSIVVFTILVRLATYPLTRKQQQSSKAMQELQPELKKLQEKYKNDRERMAQAQMELYREYGVNPLAGCLPLLIQLPILLGLYRAIVATLERGSVGEQIPVAESGRAGPAVCAADPGGGDDIFAAEIAHACYLLQQ
jgi:YidC/Oxa1 family membrane protein insertase